MGTPFVRYTTTATLVLLVHQRPERPWLLRTHLLSGISVLMRPILIPIGRFPCQVVIGTYGKGLLCLLDSRIFVPFTDFNCGVTNMAEWTEITLFHKSASASMTWTFDPGNILSIHIHIVDLTRYFFQCMEANRRTFIERSESIELVVVLLCNVFKLLREIWSQIGAWVTASKWTISICWQTHGKVALKILLWPLHMWTESSSSDSEIIILVGVGGIIHSCGPLPVLQRLLKRTIS